MSEIVVVTGMSGAGRSTAAGSLEDLGWFVIDNLPSALFTRVADLVDRQGSAGRQDDRVALVVGRAGGERYGDVPPAIDALVSGGHRVRVLFLDAPDEVLLRRYEASRRRHPQAGPGVETSIADERRLLEEMRSRADVVLDTGDLNVNQLRARVLELFGPHDESARMRTSILSFGFKHGIPMDVDLLFDCRFLPNPHWDEALRPMSGLDPAVQAFVLGQPETGPFLEKMDELMTMLVPSYVREGKSYLTLALGCTGGRHRSVALAEALAGRLRAHEMSVSTFHRDVDR